VLTHVKLTCAHGPCVCPCPLWSLARTSIRDHGYFYYLKLLLVFFFTI
jgi:hypothetical protein